VPRHWRVALTYSIQEIRGSRFGNGGPGTDQAGAIARGQYHFGVVPRSITGEPEEYDWTRYGN
jgi:hypothetical protein